MAYLQRLNHPTCKKDGCIHPATHQLFDKHGCDQGFYCAVHGQAAFERWKNFELNPKPKVHLTDLEYRRKR